MKLLSATDIGKKLEILNTIQTTYPHIHFLLHKENIRLDLHIIKNIDEAFEVPINTILYLSSEDITKSEAIGLLYKMLDSYITSSKLNDKRKYVLIIQSLFKTSQGYELKCSHLELPQPQTFCFIEDTNASN